MLEVVAKFAHASSRICSLYYMHALLYRKRFKIFIFQEVRSRLWSLYIILWLTFLCRGGLSVTFVDLSTLLGVAGSSLESSDVSSSFSSGLSGGFF